MALRSSPMLHRSLRALRHLRGVGEGGPSFSQRLSEAASALASVRSFNTAAQEMLLGDVEMESGFGYASNFATPDGSPSYNWGAIYAPGTRGTIPVGDTSEGKPFTANAAWNASAEDGARQYVGLLSSAYPGSIEAASAGDAWGFAKALYRDGHGYFGGFPPGHKWSLAPKGTVSGSDVDKYYRILAYAKAVKGAADRVASGLGAPAKVYLTAPTPPSGSAAGGSVLPLLAGLGAGAAYFFMYTVTGAGLWSKIVTTSASLSSRALLSARHASAKVFG